MEGRLAIEIVVDAGLDHILVPLGPQQLAAFGQLQIVKAHAELSPIVAQVRMRLLPVIHIGVGVIALDQVSLPSQLLGQGEVQVGPQVPGPGQGGRIPVFRV